MVGVKKAVQQASVISAVVLMALTACSSTPKDVDSAECKTNVFPLSEEVVRFSKRGAQGNAARGETLFTSLCSGCHIHGRLSPLAKAIREASGLGAPIPPKLACERFQFSYSEAYLAATIKHGGRPQFKAHSMPAWAGILNDEDVADLVAYIVSIGDITPESK